MIKVAIITLTDYKNYGNRLQNYALQEILKKFKFKVENLVVTGVKKDRICVSQRIKNLLLKKNKIMYVLKRIRTILINIIINKNKKNRLREDVFKKFVLDNVKEEKIIINSFDLLSMQHDVNDKYDYFIVGSDQVWNPNFIEHENIYFLRFAEREKRISYAASFGINKLPDEKEKIYADFLKDLKQISVREEAGAKIVKELTNIDVPVHIDPTLLLTKDEWSEIALRARNKPTKEYLLTYFLGGIDSCNKDIKDIAKKNNFEIINLGNINEKDSYITGPGEFIDYIKDCKAFITDSFHGVVFSIIFEKPFIICERIGNLDMYSRLDTLLNKFKFQDRKYSKSDFDQNLFNCDFSHVDDILKEERNKAMEYLKNALNVSGE